MSNEGNKHSDKIAGLAFVFVFLGPLIAISMTVVGYIWTVPGTSDIKAELGQTGDYFGGMLNPVFAYFSFIALLYTIRLQTNEMIAAREEAKNSVAALNAQVEHMKKEGKKTDLYRMIDKVADELHGFRSHIVPLGTKVDTFIDIPQLFGKKRNWIIFDALPRMNEETRDKTRESIEIFANTVNRACCIS